VVFVLNGFIPPGGAQSVVTKITWQKAGRVAEPGRYMFRFGWLTVAAEDLAIWERYPDAIFTLVQLPSSSDEFRLGAFELPANAGGD
jgi:hypothetical protein